MERGRRICGGGVVSRHHKESIAAVASMRALVNKYSTASRKSLLWNDHAPKSLRWLRMKRKALCTTTESSGEYSYSSINEQKEIQSQASSIVEGGEIVKQEGVRHSCPLSSAGHVHNPQYPIPTSLQILMHALNTQSPVPPDHFLQTILKSRGCPLDVFAIPFQPRRELRKKQIEDYDVDVTRAVKASDVVALHKMWEQGKTMSACNKYGESILHMACKQATLETVRFLMGHGADLSITDDYGRTPLHDACWRREPDFNIIALILSINANLLLQSDKWGFTPLMYTNHDHWTQWCSFLYYYRNSLWPLHSATAAEQQRPVQEKASSDDVETQKEVSSNTREESRIEET